MSQSLLIRMFLHMLRLKRVKRVHISQDRCLCKTWRSGRGREAAATNECRRRHPQAYCLSEALHHFLFLGVSACGRNVHQQWKTEKPNKEIRHPNTGVNETLEFSGNLARQSWSLVCIQAISPARIDIPCTHVALFVPATACGTRLHRRSHSCV